MDCSVEMVKIVCDSLEEKKAEDIVVLKVDEVSSIADYLIIANGTNPSQVKALQDIVEENLSKAGYSPRGIEGVRSNGWILMDYSDIIINVFLKEDREYYNLERIWRDAKKIDIKEIKNM